MDHAHGLALMRRAGLALFAVGFALMSLTPALQLAQVPDMVEREEALRAVQLSDAEFKGGGWKAGEFERDMHEAGARISGLGDFAMLVGLGFLALGAWAARHEPEGRRVLRAGVAVGVAIVGLGLLSMIARRLPDADPHGPLDVLQPAGAFAALALLASARGSRLALGLGIGAASVQLVTRALFFGPDLAWLHELSLHAFFGATPLLLWTSFALMAAAFAAGAATQRGRARRVAPTAIGG